MKKQETIAGNSIMDELLKNLNDRPFYEKWFSALCLRIWMIKSNALYWFMKTPKNIAGKNEIALSIKDDIEFGYDLEMIYGKIMEGCYGNDVVDEKKDWFKKHGIDWKEYMGKQKVGNSFYKEDIIKAITDGIALGTLLESKTITLEDKDKYISNYINNIKK